jgi:hypothetical protein
MSQTSRYGAIMEPMTKSWTDERLEQRFDRIDWQHDRFDSELRMQRLEMNARFDAMDRRFDAMQRLMIQIAAGTVATLLAGFLGLIATHF